MEKQKLPLRVGVGAIVLNKENKIFVGKRTDQPHNNKWQMPQGGVNDGEDLISAVKRELDEETGIKNIKILKELDEWTEYELPHYLLGKIWKGKYRGQKQKWFVMRFLGKENEIKLNTKHAEFLEWKWIRPNKLTSVVVKFKFNVYEQISKKIEEILN